MPKAYFIEARLKDGIDRIQIEMKGESPDRIVDVKFTSEGVLGARTLAAIRRKIYENDTFPHHFTENEAALYLYCTIAVCLNDWTLEKNFDVDMSLRVPEGAKV